MSKNIETKYCTCDSPFLFIFSDRCMKCGNKCSRKMNEMKTLKVGDIIKTRNGKLGRVICIDRIDGTNEKTVKPIICLILEHPNVESLRSYTSSGMAYSILDMPPSKLQASEYDLIDVVHRQ